MCRVQALSPTDATRGSFGAHIDAYSPWRYVAFIAHLRSVHVAARACNELQLCAAEHVVLSALQAGDASADNTAQEVARSIVEEVVSSAIDRVAAEPAVAEAVDEVVRAGETCETAAQSIDADEGGQAEFQIPARDSFTGDDGIEPPWYMAMCSCFGPSNWAPATNPPIEVM